MKWKKKPGWWICSAVILGLVGNIAAQEDFLIENRRTNLVTDASWGDTYVGKYTDNNALGVFEGAKVQSDDAFIGFSDTASSNAVHISDEGSEWTMDSLQIGAESNSFNYLAVWSNGVVTIDGPLSILGAANSNMFLLLDGGTLKMGSDFDAAMAGFVFESNGTLSVAGSLSNMDAVDGGRHLVLSGRNAEWLRSTNTVYIGAASSGNSLTLEDGAQLDFINLEMGAVGTSSNLFKVTSGSEAAITGNLTIAGQDNATDIGGNLTLNGNLDITGTSNLFSVAGNAKVYGDIKSNTGIQLSGSGMLEAYSNVDMETLDGSGTMLLTGEHARWTTNASISIGAADGGVTLLVQSNALVQADSIQIGSDSSTGNDITIIDGGKLILSGDGSYLHDENSLTVNDGGWLTFGTDWSTAISWGTNSSVEWGTGGTFEFQGEAVVVGSWWVAGSGSNYVEYGTLFLGSGRNMIINGSNAYWAAGAHDLHVGDLSSDNSLVISNAAWAGVKSLSIGDFKEGGDNNLVLIGGAGTTVTSLNYTAIGGTMIDGAWHEGGEGNVLRVEDGALFYSPGVLHNRNSTGSSGLEIASGAVVDVDEYYQGTGAYLTILTDSAGNAGLLSANTAAFEDGARVGVDAVARLQLDLTYTNTIVEADMMIIGGSTNGTTADLDMLGTSGGSLLNYNLLLEGGTNMVAIYSRNYISESAGFDPDSMLAEIADEIDSLASQGNVAASNQVEILSRMSDEEVHRQMEQLYAYGLPTFMHNQAVFGGIDQVRVRGRAAGTAAPGRPVGAAGPHAEDQGLQGWVKGYGGFGSRDAGDAGFDDGYDAQTFGTVFGLDRAFGAWLFGLAGGYAGSNLDGDNGDESDASTGYGILYANYGIEDWFGDIVLGYGLTDMDNTSGTDFDVTSTVEASHTAFFIGGGKEALDEASGMLIRSLLGLQVCQFSQDAYTETSPNAVGKDVEAYDRMSYQSQLGISISLPTEGSKVDLESRFRAFWLHEFNGDDEIVDYTLVDSNQPGQFVLRSPDQDVGQFGIGLLAKWRSGLRLGVDIDGQFSENFLSATLSGSLLYEF